MLQFDEDGARHIQRVYSTPDVVRQRTEVLALLAVHLGERVLDIGSGPGFLVASLAGAVGPTGTVHGLDQSAPMNTVARGMVADRHWIRIDEGDALALPYPDGAFVAATSTQVYEYVADIPKALAELRRVLRLGGRALILDTDWDSVVWHVADRERHQRSSAAPPTRRDERTATMPHFSRTPTADHRNGRIRLRQDHRGGRAGATAGVPLADVDDFHPAANVVKMSAATPLDEADRLPWLQTISRWLADHATGAVVSCSALKRWYHDILPQAPPVRRPGATGSRRGPYRPRPGSARG